MPGQGSPRASIGVALLNEYGAVPASQGMPGPRCGPGRVKSTKVGEFVMHVREMLTTHPASTGTLPEHLVECIEMCYDCAQTCTTCADACLAEDMVAELVRCIRLNLDCADVCEVTGRMMSRLMEANSSYVRTQLQACLEACRVCGDECNRHADMHEHCRTCAESCRACEESCRQMIITMGVA